VKIKKLLNILKKIMLIYLELIYLIQNMTDLEKKINFLKKNIGINKICIDTEGAQIRTGQIVKKPKLLKKNQKCFIGFDKSADYQFIHFLTHHELKVGSKVQIGFEDLVLKDNQ
jgi:pyruvate kinase